MLQEFLISRDQEVMGGTPVFAGTRVPVQALIEELMAGRSIHEFQEGYPRVETEQIIELLRRVSEMLETAHI
ncbi:MAG: DUF433 domain-containing protein [Herpetosiphonaceae bacterium]|nr:DUF433 domain-containing protein [Herpetosiphonaceae bacterium]